MKRSHLIFSLCLALTTAAAHAQLSVYATFTYDDYTFSKSSTSAPIVSEDNAGGLSVGASYDVTIYKDLALGADLRGGYNSSTSSSNSFIGSAKFTYSPHDSIPRLYIQTGIGDIHVTTPSTASALYPQTTAKVTSTLFQYAFGFDIQCQHGIDIRLLEVDFTHDLGQATANNLAVNTTSYSIGVVYYIPHTSKKRRYYD